VAARVAHAPSSVVLFSAGSFCVGCFLVFSQIVFDSVLWVGFSLVIAFSTDCL
jgi:hypothetical protein